MSSENLNQQQQIKETAINIKWVPNADEISMGTVVNMLIEKGICSADELLALEGKIREQQVYNKSTSIVEIKKNYNRGRFPGLKRIMSKHRWSRRLGTWLFGWKWKKVKKHL